MASAYEAQKEMETEQEKFKSETTAKKASIISPSEVLFPWETYDESLAILSETLREEILNISAHDCNFTRPPTSELLASESFDFNGHVQVVLKTLQYDVNLAAVHARIAPKMAEEIFWRNYFLRTWYGMICVHDGSSVGRYIVPYVK